MRDPRLDPVVGDIVRGKSGMLRQVLTTWDGGMQLNVRYTQQRNGAAPTKRVTWLAEWRRWCAHNDAVIISVAKQ
jgi:hypothetical protein